MPSFLDEDRLPMLIGLLEMGIAMARQASKSIDPTLRLEKFLASVVRIQSLSWFRLTGCSMKVLVLLTKYSMCGKLLLSTPSQAIKSGWIIQNP